VCAEFPPFFCENICHELKTTCLSVSSCMLLCCVFMCEFFLCFPQVCRMQRGNVVHHRCRVSEFSYVSYIIHIFYEISHCLHTKNRLQGGCGLLQMYVGCQNFHMSYHIHIYICMSKSLGQNLHMSYHIRIYIYMSKFLHPTYRH